MSKFGWDLPPGCTQQHIDEAFGGDQAPCATCGRDPADCTCPVCPQCGEIGNEYCYDTGHIKYTTAQLVGRARVRILQLERTLEDEISALRYLEEQLDREDARAVDILAAPPALEPESDTAEDLGFARPCCPYHAAGGDINNSCGGDIKSVVRETRGREPWKLRRKS